MLAEKGLRCSILLCWWEVARCSEQAVWLPHSVLKADMQCVAKRDSRARTFAETGRRLG